MTSRKSKRELEQAVEDLEGSEDTDEPLNVTILRKRVDTDDGDAVHTERVTDTGGALNVTIVRDRRDADAVDGPGERGGGE